MSEFANVPVPAAAVPRRLLAMFDAVGESDYIGEPLSMLAHSLQAAALSDKQCGDDEVTVAALLHDIGHAVGMEAGFPLGMNDCGIPEHESVGEEFLKQLQFTPRIQKLVRHHVTAKRYLCFKKPAYAANLSEASRTTLGFQGGPMSASEAALFEADPDFAVIVLMRKWDEAAKVPGLDVPDFRSYFPLLDKFSSQTGSSLLTRPPNLYIISTQQLKFYREYGYVKIPSFVQFHHEDAEAAAINTGLSASLQPLLVGLCDGPLRQAAAQILGRGWSGVEEVRQEDEGKEEVGLPGGRVSVTAVVATVDAEGVLVAEGGAAEGMRLQCRAGDVVLLSRGVGKISDSRSYRFPANVTANIDAEKSGQQAAVASFMTAIFSTPKLHN